MSSRPSGTSGPRQPNDIERLMGVRAGGRLEFHPWPERLGTVLGFVLAGAYLVWRAHDAQEARFFALGTAVVLLVVIALRWRPCAGFKADGQSLTLDFHGRQRFDWDDVTGLERTARGWRLHVGYRTFPLVLHASSIAQVVRPEARLAAAVEQLLVTRRAGPAAPPAPRLDVAEPLPAPDTASHELAEMRLRELSGLQQHRPLTATELEEVARHFTALGDERRAAQAAAKAREAAAGERLS